MSTIEFPQQPSKRDELIEAQEQITQNKVWAQHGAGPQLSPVEMQVASIDELNRKQDSEEFNAQFENKLPQEAEDALARRVVSEYEDHFGHRHADELQDRLATAEAHEATTVHLGKPDDDRIIQERTIEEVRLMHIKGEEPTVEEELRLRDVLAKVYRQYVEQDMLSPEEASLKLAQYAGIQFTYQEKHDAEFLKKIASKIITHPDRAHLN